MRSSSCMSWNNGRQSLRRTTLKDIGHNRILRKSSIKRIQCRRCGCARREGKGRDVSAYFDPNRRFRACPQGAARAKAHAEKILNGVAEEARSAGVICETVQIEEDHPYEAIIETAKQRGCDLIVMGSHGRSGIAAIVLGSVTTKVLTHTKIPVLVCH